VVNFFTDLASATALLKLLLIDDDDLAVGVRNEPTPDDEEDDPGRGEALTWTKVGRLASVGRFIRSLRLIGVAGITEIFDAASEEDADDAELIWVSANCTPREASVGLGVDMSPT
jgi:hypothetical protein